MGCGVKRKVKNVETGEIYSSLQEAADATGHPKNSIYRWCNLGRRTSLGNHWEYVDDCPMHECPQYHRDIAFASSYSVTPDGRIWSKANGIYLKPSVVLGYAKVQLTTNDGDRRIYPVHRLVAYAFIPNPDNLPCINHKDENKLNNAVGNLEWCTYKYNANYGTRTARASKTSQIPIVELTTGRVFNSLADASSAFGVSKATIIKSHKHKKPLRSNLVFREMEVEQEWQT